LAPTIIEAIADTIRRIKEEGLSIVFVEQNAEVIFDLVDRYFIVEEGRTVYSGDKLTEELQMRYLSV
jgi:branched-chain amino acid transport system ATP-binding protein